jgi:hypothetical protein
MNFNIAAKSWWVYTGREERAVVSNHAAAATRRQPLLQCCTRSLVQLRRVRGSVTE